MFDITNFEKFINSISYDLDDDLYNIYIEALANHVPVIRKPTIDLLRLLLSLRKPKEILELGCAVGFSGSFMLRQSENLNLTTIERNDKRIKKAKENFKKLNLENRVNLIEGDILDIIDSIDKKFDFVFLDSAKGSYNKLLPKILKLLKSGGILVTDNILQDGELLHPRSVINQRDRTTYDRMRQFVYELYHNDKIITTIIPCGDGVAISVKN